MNGEEKRTGGMRGGEYSEKADLLRRIGARLPQVDPGELQAGRAGVCIYWKDREQRFVGVNSAFLDYYGLREEELIGRTAQELGLIDEAQGLREQERQVLSGEHIYSHVADARVRGQSRAVLFSETPVRDRKGESAGLVGFFVDITPYRDIERRLREAALRDELTSLRNRRAMREESVFALHQQIYLFLLDVDHFKEVNDRRGHAYGDALLCRVAGALQQVFGMGHCYRIGGDEFVVLGSFVSEEELRERYAALQGILASLDVLGNPGCIRVSAGYVYGTADSTEEIEGMLAEADQQLYRAKRAGRNRLFGGPRPGKCSSAQLHRDSLTGLPDADAFYSEGESRLEEIAARGEQAFLVYTDCYGTHAYNDRRGYEAGNRMLAQTGRLLAEAFPGDLLARQADDRFVLITAAGAQEIRRRIDEVNVRLCAWSENTAVGIRAGVYAWAEGERLLTALDRARRAKTYYDLDHVNRTHFYDGRVRSFIDNKDYLLTNLDRAVREGWIQVLWQPVMGGLSGKISSLEALARWVDPERGTLLPEDFVPDLEAVNLIHLVDLTVFRTACRELAALRRQEGLQELIVSVNLSCRTLEQPQIHETLNGILQEYGLERTAVGIELCETGRAGDRGLLQRHFRRFHEDGYLTFLDHFGEGSSSLEGLQGFDYDFIKVDLRELGERGERTRELMISLTKLFKCIDAHVAVVGVQTQEEFDFLRSIGCGIMEGQFLSKALPSEKIPALLRERGLEVETLDDHFFYLPIGAVNVLDGTVGLPGREKLSLVQEQPVFIIALEGGVFRTLYENPVTVKQEERAGRHSYAEFDRLMNDRTDTLYPLLLSKTDHLTRVGERDSYNAVTSYVKVRMRVQLISSRAGRRAYLITGSDMVELGQRDPADPGAEQYWRQMQELQLRDVVTGLGSVRTFQQEMSVLGREIAAGTGRAAAGSWDLVHFNIAQFAAYNRSHGFEAGNALLRQLGLVIRQVLGTELVTRYYADHFYALAPDRDIEEKIGRIRERMLDNGIRSVSLHAGIYTLEGEETETSRAIDRARIAGSYAGSDPGESIARFAPWMEEEMIRSGYILAHVDEAIARGWIRLYLQPVADTSSSHIVGLEALARWEDPHYGFLSPLDFIPVLEDAHLIYKLDLHMIGLVCAELCRVRERGEKPLPVSVNLSQTDFLRPDLHEAINAILQESGVDRSLLRIEITESALLDNTAELRGKIRRFRQDGYQVWMDDFGSGYSSLGALHEYDFDVIKIDMSFLGGSGEKMRALLQEVVALAARMGARPLMEGVENEEQAQMLHEMGCSLIQGYLLSKPAPAEEIGEVLQGLEGTWQRE